MSIEEKQLNETILKIANFLAANVKHKNGRWELDEAAAIKIKIEYIVNIVALYFIKNLNSQIANRDGLEEENTHFNQFVFYVNECFSYLLKSFEPLEKIIFNRELKKETFIFILENQLKVLENRIEELV